MATQVQDEELDKILKKSFDDLRKKITSLMVRREKKLVKELKGISKKIDHRKPPKSNHRDNKHERSREDKHSREKREKNRHDKYKRSSTSSDSDNTSN